MCMQEKENCGCFDVDEKICHFESLSKPCDAGQ